MGSTCRGGERRGACRVLVGIPEGWRQLGRLRHGWEDNIKMNELDQSVSGLGKVSSSCKCDNEPLSSIKCREFLE
jgi:hypothetical protein